MSYVKENFRDLDVMNNFMFNKLTTEPEIAQKFCRLMIKSNRKIEGDYMTLGDWIDDITEDIKKSVSEEYKEKGLAEGRAEGRKIGMAEGRAEGIRDLLIAQVKDGEITIEKAARRLEISVDEFEKLLNL